MSGPQRFRKRPVVVEAMRWNGTAAGATSIIDWVLGSGGTATYRCSDPVRCEVCDGNTPHAIVITTLEGVMIASLGDRVIKGVSGEFYLCKPDVFAASYEAERDEPEGAGLMTDIVDRARQALSGVTNGPWEFRPVLRGVVSYGTSAMAQLVTAETVSTADGEFIAAARALVPELIAEVDRLRGKAARVEALAEAWERATWRNGGTFAKYITNALNGEADD